MSISKNCIECIGAVLLVLVWYILQFNSWDGTYIDTDNYFHALRLTQWFNNPSFFEQKMDWSNYPFGEVSHWTRFFYVIWGILSLPFLFWYPVKIAIFYAGMLVCPVFCCLGIVFLLKALQSVFSLKFRWLVIILLGVQANFWRNLLLSRPDHHALFVCLCAVLFYLVTRFVIKKDEKTLRLIAFSLSVGLWVAVEGVFLFIAFMIFLVGMYLFLEYKFEWIKEFLFWYALGCSVCLLVNPCYEGWFYVDTGRLSILYVIVAWCFYLCSILAFRFERKWVRVSVFGGLGVVTLLVLYALGWLKSPVDDRLVSIFINRITEMEKINIYTGAYPLLGIVCGAMICCRHKNDEVFWYLFISLILFGVLSLFGVRFLAYSGLYGAIITILFLEDRSNDKKKIWNFALFFVLLEYISFVVNVMFLGAQLINPTVVSANDVVTLDFNKFKTLGKGSVVSDTFFAPYIVWYTNRAVVASPYHRNVEGIIDNHNILFSSDEEEVIKLIKKHNVGVVYLTEVSGDFYKEPLKNCDKLYGKILGCKNYPSWLKPVNDSNGDLFEIDYSKID